MRKLLEFKTIVVAPEDFNDKSFSEEEIQDRVIMEHFEEEDKDVDRIVTYSFAPRAIVDVRESFIEYQKQYLPSVVCSFTIDKKGKEILTTPHLLASHEEFKKELNEYYKKENKAK